MISEEEKQALLAQSPAPRVTAEQMQARIANTFYTIYGTMTTAYITLDNGYVVTGESACVNPENFDQAIGEKIAYDDAFAKLWPLFGFLLAERRYEDGKV